MVAILPDIPPDRCPYYLTFQLTGGQDLDIRDGGQNCQTFLPAGGQVYQGTRFGMVATITWQFCLQVAMSKGLGVVATFTWQLTCYVGGQVTVLVMVTTITSQFWG
jgi:hypothetical protein